MATLFTCHCLTPTQNLPSQRICPFNNVSPDSMHGSFFNTVDAYCLEHSGSLSLEARRLLGVGFFDGCLPCAEPIIPLAVLPSMLMHAYCYSSTWKRDSIGHRSSLQAMLHLGIPRGAQMSCCQSPCRHGSIKVPASLLQGLLITQLLLPFAAKFHV